MIGRTTIAFTGIRDVDPAYVADIEMAVLDAIGSGAAELRFGGALGSDTIALTATKDKPKDCETHAYVPFRVGDQPKAAQDAIRKYADAVTELGLPKGKAAFLQRNRVMIGAGEGPVDLVIAFSDGRKEGGTYQTMREADKRGIPVSVVAVRAKNAPVDNPLVRGDDLRTKVYAYKTYQRDSLSGLVKRIKSGTATTAEVRSLADKMIRFVKTEPDLRECDVVVAMPRRLPGIASDMQPIANAIATELGMAPGELARVAEPTRGQVLANRLRFTPETHARTLRYRGSGGRVLVLDNVITSGGTMDGAALAIERCGGRAVGLAVLVSESLGLEAE